ncbi:polyhydroxybutyrate depolymerase [Pseudofrankia sp. BMG5.36]|nr:polyhydroxybutyrate depolymerase [Pseudofrankia sp. BMG5.36]
MTAGGVKRSYEIHVPPGTGTAPRPLVVELHGGGGNNGAIERQTGFFDLADQKGFLVASPNGTGRLEDRMLTWNAGWCCGQAAQNGVDDVGFIAAMLDDIAAHYPLDTRRVYVTGFSNGAMMTYRLGCALADRLAAIAPVSGALDYDGCTPSRPVPLLAIHGTADQNVPYNGGTGAVQEERFPSERGRVDRSVADSVAFWVRRDGCPATPVAQHDGAVTRTTYMPCADGTEVVLDTVDGGGHAWPGGRKGRPRADAPAADLDATAAIWDFFARHELPRQ